MGTPSNIGGRRNRRRDNGVRATSERNAGDASLCRGDF